MKNAQYYYIYKITNLINGKVYIGLSIVPHARWRRHLSDAKLNKDTKHLSRAIRKYGKENFSFEILITATTLEEADELEIKTIFDYNSANRKFGYNKALGGSGKRIVSEETKKKLSIINTGKKATEETKKRMSESMIGKNAGSKNGMFGLRSPLAKFTFQQAENIRNEYKTGQTSMAKLAQKYKVSKRTVLNIIHNKIYKV